MLRGLWCCWRGYILLFEIMRSEGLVAIRPWRRNGRHDDGDRRYEALITLSSPSLLTCCKFVVDGDNDVVRKYSSKFRREDWSKVR